MIKLIENMTNPILIFYSLEILKNARKIIERHIPELNPILRLKFIHIPYSK